MKRKRTVTGRIVGGRIRELRKERGLRQCDLASALRTDTPSVSHIEHGRKDLRLTDLEKLARVLGVRLADLVAPIDHAMTVPRSAA
jgi:transcriptional regulator with XRE-family HTH domain